MARPRVSKKLSEAVAVLTGKVKEPQFTSLNSDQRGMLDALNYYNAYSKRENSKKFALAWVKKNLPELTTVLKDVKDHRFENRGFVCRILENGYIMSETEMTRHINFFKDLATNDKVHVSTTQPGEYTPPAVKNGKKPEPINKALEAFDLAIDEAVKGGYPTTDLPANKADLDEVQKIIAETKADIEENRESYSTRAVNHLRSFFRKVEKDIAAKATVVKQKAVRKTAPKKIQPAKMVAGLKYAMQNAELDTKGIHPTKVVGAKQAIVYNAKYRFLMLFVAASDDGLMFSGSSIKNYDLQKSFFKKIRKPEDLATVLKVESTAGMKRYLKELNGKEFECKARFNEDTIILKI